MRFYTGMHIIQHCHRLPYTMVSYQRLRDRRSDFPVNEWILDSGAFTEVALRGGYRDAPDVYAAAVERWSTCGRMVAAASQDYMCEPMVLAKTGMSVADHQRLTIERYDVLRTLVPSSIHLLPVIQGYLPEHYQAHIAAYGDRLRPGMWVGVGSVCKRNGRASDAASVLRAIAQLRPDLRLHGFGLKVTALESADVRAMLHSADSMAWSMAARRAGRDANSWLEADAYRQRIEAWEPKPLTPMEQLWSV